MEDRSDAVSALLNKTEAAHGAYETAELDGVYDQDWPAWYATHAVEQGIGVILGHPIAAEELARFLAGTFADFKAAEPTPTDGWAVYAARRIVAEL